MDSLAKIVLPQIEDLVQEFEKIEKAKKYNDWSDIDSNDASEFITAGMNAIYRAVGLNNPLSKRLETVIANSPPHHAFVAVPHIGGALKALRKDITSGYLVSIQELIHAEVFADFLEMAQHLLEEGYKDPAAVLVGGVLEEHLRKLCNKQGISIEFTNSKGDVNPKKADTMNADLAKSGVYSGLDQKNITAWLALRNKAAHGKHSEYTHQQVELLLQSIQDFLTRHPA